MRGISTVFITFVFVLATAAQTADDLRTRLGEPESTKTDERGVRSEEYLASPSLRVLIRYSKKGHPEFLRVAPASSTLTDIETDPVVNQDIFREFLDKVVPKTERGKYKMGTFLDIICLPKNDCAGVEEDYERLTVHYADGRGGMRWASITWKRPDSKAK